MPAAPDEHAPSTIDGRFDGHTDVFAERTLNARSVALSVLLGSHPPALPARALVALAELFGIAPGTMRTALSRLVANGEAVLVDSKASLATGDTLATSDTVQGAGAGAVSSWYQLAGDILERQRSQDEGVRTPNTTDARSWDGTWHLIASADDQRSLGERRRFRVTMTNHRFAELRPDIWLRPANTPAPTNPDWIVVTGDLAGRDPHDVVARLWDLDELAATASRLLAGITHLEQTLDWACHDSIPTAFTAAADVIRFLRREPRLPAPLTPERWPVDELRAAYASFERLQVGQLRTFLQLTNAG